MSKISIIIATCNRFESLKKTLDSLLIQDYSEAFSHDIIVVDNNSTDDTKAVIDSYKHKFPGQTLLYMFEGRQGKSFALNTAIAKAKGDIIVFIDDDVILYKDWLQKIHDFTQSYDFDAATGRIVPRYPPDVPSWVKENIDLLSGPIVSYDYGEEVKEYDGKTMNPLVGANMIVKRHLFDEAGLFDTNLGPGAGTFGDDTEISIRWGKRNKRLYYVGTAAVWHPVTKDRMTLKYIARWNMAFGRYCVVKDKGAINKSLVCYGGTPRYLFRSIFGHIIKLIGTCFNKRKLLDHWVSLFRDIGSAKTYREYYLSQAKRA